MYTFSEIISTFEKKIKATSKIKIQQVLNNPRLNTGIQRDYDKMSTNSARVNFYPNEGAHWVCHIDENYFDYHGICPSKKLSTNKAWKT